MIRQLTLIFALTLALFACKGKPAPATTTTEAPPLPADVQAVATSAAQAEESDMIVATGEFISPTRSELAVKMPGRVGRMYVNEGDHVAKGQPVLELETDYIRLNLQRAQAEAARAKAMLDDAARDLERKKDLIAKDSIPQATFDRSQTNYDQARASYAASSASAALLRQQLGDATLRSPINGVVAEKRTDVGQRLGEATVAVVIAQTSPLKLRFRVPERYLANVHRGQPVTASVDPYPNEKFEGKVTGVGGVIDPATRSLTVETEFPNRDGRLRPGLFARVELRAKS